MVPRVGLQCMIVVFPENAYFFLYEVEYNAVQSKKDSKNQETIQSCTTPDPGYHMGK